MLFAERDEALGLIDAIVATTAAASSSSSRADGGGRGGGDGDEGGAKSKSKSASKWGEDDDDDDDDDDEDDDDEAGDDYGECEDEAEKDSALHRLRAVLDGYLDCPTLLDPHLESICSRMMIPARDIVHKIYLDFRRGGEDDVPGFASAVWSSSLEPSSAVAAVR